MLDARPQEPEWVSWLYVIAGALVIFLTVPIARALQAAVSGNLGEIAFLYLSLAAVIPAGIWAVRFLRNRHTPKTAYLWLLLVAGIYSYYAWQLRRNAIEAIHLVEYGFLSVLVFRALVHRIRDVSIYITAIVIVGIIGVVDEWIQWIVPSRYWDLRDVQTNLIAASLTQLAIGAGLRPTLVSGWPAAANLGRLCIALFCGIFLLGLSYANTPQRISVYARQISPLSFLLNSKSMMVEYGYYHTDPAIGGFRSRFTLDELEELDERRGAALAIAFDAYISDEKFGEFQEIYSVPRDPYIHEAGIHLFRRNRYLEVSMTQEVRRNLHYNIALRENQILERYFPTGLSESSHVWSDATRAHVEAHTEKMPNYESRVSRDLITRVSEQQILSGFGTAAVVLLALGIYLRRKGGSPAPMSLGGEEGATL